MVYQIGAGIGGRAGRTTSTAGLFDSHLWQAAGCHGAVVCGVRKSFVTWSNYGYPVIYSTALPLHSQLLSGVRTTP
jgi:7-keto-8-aminopelargonate synthetase-like enzyme